MPFNAAPVGELTSIGIGKELATAFASPVAPVIFYETETFTPSSKNTLIPRPGSAKRAGRRPPSTGGYAATMSFRPGSTPDTIGQLIAYGMGVQSTPALTGASLVAYKSTCSFGTSIALPSFTTEFNRVTDAVDYAGCCVDTMKFALDSDKGLAVDFGLVAATEVINAAPVAPTFSNKNILTMEAPSTSVTINGVTIGASGAGQAVIKWDVTLNNQLQKNYRGAGSGRKVLGFPLGTRMVAASMTLGFESNSLYQQFYGAVGATSPGAAITGVPIVLTVGSQDLADAAKSIYYSITLRLANCFIESAPVANKTSGALEQVLTIYAAESAAGGNDDLAIDLVNLAAAVY